jgi:acyl-CoA dehydrogenase
VKLFCSEIANRIADKAIIIHGCMGYMKELSVEMYFRDVRLYRIFEGTSEIQRKVIAKELLKV